MTDTHRTSRKLEWIVFIAIAFVFSLSYVAYQMIHAPFRNMEAYVAFVEARDVEKAKALLAEESLSSIPIEYWDEIVRDDSPVRGCGVSYTPESLLHGVVTFWLYRVDGDSTFRDNAVTYQARRDGIYTEQ